MADGRYRNLLPKNLDTITNVLRGATSDNGRITNNKTTAKTTITTSVAVTTAVPTFHHGGNGKD